MIGMKFGDLNVIDFDMSEDKYWLQCKCGKMVIRSGDELRFLPESVMKCDDCRMIEGGKADGY